MIHPISQMTPFLPTRSKALMDQALGVFHRSSSLAGKVHPITMQRLIDFLRITNTYYSNLIEDHHTHPIDIERAMAHQYDSDPAKRDLQEEARAHVTLERELDGQIAAGPCRPTSPEFLRSIHQRFYEKLPERFRWLENTEGNASVPVIPGEFRTHYVKVGRLVPVAPDAIDRFMVELDRQYDLERHAGLDGLLAIAAAHHRLMWIHPFTDGNGRVARLFTGAAMKTIGLIGHGLWSINRGLARFKSDYLAVLADADSPRQGDLDGRGQLSQRGLDRFCDYFLSTCLDQIAFMGDLLDLDSLLERIEQYIHLRANHLIPGEAPIRKEARHLIREAFVFGEFPRGQASRLTGLKERTARSLLAQMVEDGLLTSDTPKGPVRLQFSTRLLPTWFPHLGPD